MEETLSGRVAIVTGGSRGIGQAIVLKLVSAGASVVIGGISDTSRTHSLVLEAGGSEVRLLSIKTDVTKAEEVNRLVKSTIDHFGKVDVLVNNAGINRDALLLRMKDGDWDAVLDTNLKGAFLCTRAVLVHMVRSRWGRIVNISSVVGLIGNPGQANYSAAKAGLIGLTKTTAREVASRGITVNAVAPGFIDTDMTRGLSDQVKERLQGLIPQKRFGTPEDVAHVVAFLTSPKSSYITGQVVGVNGGMFMA